MQIPLEIDYRNLEPTPALAAVIRKKTAKLEQFYDRITGCHVTLEAPHRHHHQGKQFQVHIRLTLPGKVLAVSHASGNQAHEDAYVAIRDAFAAAQRQLEDYVRIRRGVTKTHPIVRRRKKTGQGSDSP